MLPVLPQAVSSRHFVAGNILATALLRILSAGNGLVSPSSHFRTGLAGIGLVALFLVAGCGGGDSPEPPTLRTTAFQVQEGQSLSASLGARDPAGTAMTITVDSGPAHGALTGPDATGAFTFQPNPFFSGADSFHVTVADAKGVQTSASILITVQHVPAPPVANADSARTAPAMPVTINVLANDTDPRGHPLTPQITQSANGAAVVNSDGTVTFTPAAGFAGTATVVYQDVNTENDTSAAANIQVLVRPLQKLVYLTATPRILIDDTNTITTIKTVAGARDPLAISLSANGRTLLYNTSPIGSTVWSSVDLRGSLTGQNVATTGVSFGTGLVALSNDGTQALYPVNGMSGFFVSTELFLRSLYGLSGGKVNAGTFTTEQVNDYYFADQDRSIYYISHAPANYQSRSAIFGTTVAAIGTAVQLTPTTPDGDTIATPLRITSSGSQIVYMAVRNNTTGVYEVDTSTPGTELVLGPTVTNTAGSLNLTSFGIASQGHYGAYVIQWMLSGTARPAYAHLVNLDQPGSHSPIGSGFPNGTNLSAPLFSPDGTYVLFAITESTGVALYEASVTQPANLVQMSPIYSAPDAVITNFQYTPDGLNIVYTEGTRSKNVFDLFTVQRSHPGTATQLNQELGTSVFNSVFSISADSTTIAYTQAKTSGGAPSLFLVDRTTPGLPFEAAQNMPVAIGQGQPFYFLPAK